MKTCPTCNQPVDDGAAFCGNCGAPLGQQQPDANPNGAQQPPYGAYQPYQAPVNPYDHTADFDAKDISENKVYCMFAYLSGFIGIIIALLASGSSPYIRFHIRQVLKFSVVDVLLGIVAALTAWTFIVPIAAGIMFLVLLVIKIICFFQVGSGKAVEPAIIRNLNFLH